MTREFTKTDPETGAIVRRRLIISHCDSGWFILLHRSERENTWRLVYSANGLGRPEAEHIFDTEEEHLLLEGFTRQ